MKFLCLALALCVTLPALGAHVLAVSKKGDYIGVSHEAYEEWQLGDEVCVIRATSEIACGTVKRVASKGAIVKIRFEKQVVMRGDIVRRGQAHSERTIAASEKPELLSSTEKVDTNSLHENRFNLSAGMNVGFNYYYPDLHFQYAALRHFAFGIRPTYLSTSVGDSSVSAFGLLATANYYHQQMFRGLWARVGAGPNFFSVKTSAASETQTSGLFIGTIGWRGAWDFGLNVGISIGFQYTTDPHFTTVTVQTLNFRPLLAIDVGLNF